MPGTDVVKIDGKNKTKQNNILTFNIPIVSWAKKTRAPLIYYSKKFMQYIYQFCSGLRYLHLPVKGPVKL